MVTAMGMLINWGMKLVSAFLHKGGFPWLEKSAQKMSFCFVTFYCLMKAKEQERVMEAGNFPPFH